MSFNFEGLRNMFRGRSAKKTPSFANEKSQNLIPLSWLPDAPMDRVHLHWTAGSHVASSLDREHYHLLIEGDGKPIKGHISITGNIPPLKSGKYAAHTRRANSNSVGIACCSMAGATTNPLSAGKFPLTEVQWKNTIVAIAEVCRKYDIPVTDKTVLTHAEVQSNLGIKQNGKWDITYLPFWRQEVNAKAVGDRMRAEVSEILK